MNVLPPPPAWVQERLLSLVGLRSLDMSDVLHMDLAKGVYELGAGAPDGQVLQRLRWHFAWHLRDAGELYATARADHDHLIDRTTVRLRAESAKGGGKALSRAEAEQIARADDATYQAHLRLLLAEQRERSMRKFLDAVDSAIELHRTDRADQRKADFHHAQGMTGGA